MNGSRVYCDIFNEEGGVAIGVSVDGHEVLLEQRCADFPGTTRHSGWMGDLRVWGDSIQHSKTVNERGYGPVPCVVSSKGGRGFEEWVSGMEARERGAGVAEVREGPRSGEREL